MSIHEILSENKSMFSTIETYVLSDIGHICILIVNDLNCELPFCEFIQNYLKSVFRENKYG